MAKKEEIIQVHSDDAEAEKTLKDTKTEITCGDLTARDSTQYVRIGTGVIPPCFLANICIYILLYFKILSKGLFAWFAEYV